MTDCTIQKRLYRKGFYFDGVSKKREVQQSNSLKYNEISFNPVQPLAVKKQKVLEEQVEWMSFNDNKEKYSLIRKKTYRFIQDTCNDKLILRTGEILVVQVIEVSEDNIKYKRCDMLDGPMYSVDVNKVYAIEFRNGHKEYFENKKLQEKTIKGETEKEFPLSLTMALIIAISGVLGYGLVLYPFIPILSLNAKKKIKAQPEKYKGWELSGCLFVGSLVVIVVVALAILFLFIIDGNLLAGLPFNYLFLFFLILVGIALFIAAVNSKRTPNKDTQL